MERERESARARVARERGVSSVSQSGRQGGREGGRAPAVGDALSCAVD
eukprot:COSAG01_NODE_21011_length_922_cov_2.518834_1_plen_47_part_10